MPTADVLMPQMGESITEGTITRWLKKLGERVAKDEPLFEISTDKVDAEIPSPVAGTLAKILAQEGQTIAVHAVVAQIEASDDAVSTEQPAATPEAAETKSSVAKSESAPKPAAISAPAPRATPEEAGDEDSRMRSSPLVRRLAKEHNVNLSNVEGTGPGGRITKEDLLAYVERQKTSAPAPPASRATPGTSAPRPAPVSEPGTRVEIVPMTPMRKKIAERMVLSRHTAAHCTSVFQVDLTKVVGIYQREKERFEQQENVKLSYTPFFVRAVIDGLKRFPIVNSSVSGEDIIYKKDIHMGIAVALDWGLIVPVIQHADEKSFLGLTRAINDLAERARQKRLAVSEVEGGTFTITNPGSLGGLFATPIINPPQVGIVGVGGVHKEPVVINDAIAIRSIVHLSLSYDHRVIDGAVADQFLASVKNYLEDWEEDLFA
ncbi:MAG: dihydrolipoyllysine-residue succinyltransferase [Acidobacteria bacterium]|nr:dihydrolipoyllysine-residue succinyltransferase [Acidobacteriota bacterium]